MKKKQNKNKKHENRKNHIFVLLFSIFFILSFAIYSVLCLQLIQPIGCHTNKIIIIINTKNTKNACSVFGQFWYIRFLGVQKVGHTTLPETETREHEKDENKNEKKREEQQEQQQDEKKKNTKSKNFTNNDDDTTVK